MWAVGLKGVWSSLRTVTLGLKEPAAEVFIVRIEGNRNIKKGGL